MSAEKSDAIALVDSISQKINMSVFIIPTPSPAEAYTINTDDGQSCKCRNDFWRTRPSKDLANGISVRKEAFTLDLAPLLKQGSYDAQNPISVFLNCGSVPVEERRCWDVTIYNSDRIRKGQQYRNFRTEETEEDKNNSSRNGVFRILNHPKHDMSFPNNEDDPGIKCNTKVSVADTKRLQFRVLFQPQLPNILYTRTVRLWIDNVPLKLQLRGLSIGPSVCLSRHLVNFGGVYVGNRGRRLIELHNHSLAPARFQFQVDNIRSTFKICPSTGVVPPYSTVKVEVTFHPFAARSFYKRTYCLIHHQEPLVLDCLGICVPRPRFLPVPISFGVKMEQAMSLPFPTDTFQDFTDGDQRWGVHFEFEKIDFGYRDPEMAYPDRRSGIQVTALSRLPYDTILEWAPDPSMVFNILPSSSTLKANDKIQFSVNFKPNFPGAFYQCTLECYVYPASDAYDDGGPIWDYSASNQYQRSRKRSRKTKNTTDSGELKKIKSTTNSGELKKTKSTTNSGELKPADPANDSGESIVEGAKEASPETSSESAARTKSLSPSPVPFANNEVKKEASAVPFVLSKDHALDQKDLHKGNGYFMKVNMSRINEGQDIHFLVTPVTDNLTSYDIPETLSSDEDIRRYLRHEESYSSMGGVVDTLKDCASKRIQLSQPENDNVASLNRSMDLGGATGSDADLNGEVVEEPVVPIPIPSIHPLNLILPGNDEVNQSPVLDGIKRIALPLCITLKLTGHTFTPQRVPFIPNVKLPLKAEMFASTPNVSTGRTFLVKNMSDLPCLYSLDKPEGYDAFQVRPLVGLIHGNQHEIIVACMKSTTEQNAIYKADVGITFNITDNCSVGLYGYCEVPTLNIHVLYESSARGSEIVCPVTIAGCVAYTYVELQNPTGFHYRFWIEPADVENEDWMIISPKPSAGSIGPNETIPIAWKFAPKIDGMYYLYWRFCFEVDRTSVPEKSLGYYEFIIPFTGTAKTSYLNADPNVLDFELIQIFDTKSKVVTVKNDGECPVNAHFIVHHEQWLSNFPPDLITVNPSRISLKPQESAQIVVTVRPTKSTLQRFYIIYNLEFKDDDEFVEGAAMDVFEKHLVDVTFMGDHSVFKVTDIILDSIKTIWDAEQCWSMFSISLLNQLLTPQHFIVEGTVPQVSSVSFRFPPAPINSEPCVVKLHISNVSELKGYWATFTKPPNGWRRLVQQKVCGTCATLEFKDGHYSDTPDLASQIWSKRFSYSTAVGAANKIPSTCNSPKDLVLFEISPTNGTLKSKESQVITIKYYYTSPGPHEISVLLRIFPAIFIWVELRGRTLDVNQPHLQLMNRRQMKLHPISLSDIDPPVQMFWVYNGGNVIASYTVDLEPFEKLKDENFGHAVMECLTPKGDVPPRSWAPIKLKFSPLEYTTYTVPLILFPHYDKTSSHVTLIGTAPINPGVNLRPHTFETIRKFVLFSPTVPVTVSPSHITIGHLIPTGHSITRVIFLTNLHARNTMKYHWQNLPIEGGGMISFHPNGGRLSPKEEASCKIVIKAGDTPTVLSTMIVCTIEDETAQILYEFVFNQWRDYMKNTQLRDSEQSSSDPVSHKPEPPDVYNRLLAVSLYIGSPFGQYDSLTSKEKARMGFAAPVSSVGGNPKTILPFTASGSQLCQSIISDMIWDLIQSPSFPAFSRSMTRRKAPLFEEYADVENSRSETLQRDSKGSVDDSFSGGESKEEVEIALHSTSEILEKTIFNILHEMAERYAHDATKAKWSEVPPIQPKAFVNVEKYKQLFQ